MNAFDNGNDNRATVVIVMREREGKAGGGKGALLANDKTFTLSTSNFHTIFILDGTRVGDVRFYEDTKMQTIIQRWGTGGGNVPYIVNEKNEEIPILGGQHPNAGIGIGLSPTLTSASGMGGGHTPLIPITMQVRRLTPKECERLQGFPDDWTDGQADSHRYKQMGNAVAVPVVEWIISRLMDSNGSRI